MLEKQYTDFLMVQMKSKISILERETEHQAVKELKACIDQLPEVFASLLSTPSPQPRQTRTRRTSNTPE